MDEFKNTGGAKIGILKSSWPFATLTVTRNKLELNVSLIGKFVFLPGDITAITPNRKGYKMGVGIKIYHKIPQYKDEIIFWSAKKPHELVDLVMATGFLNNTVPTFGAQAEAEVRALQSQGGFALKKNVAICLVVLWNIFLIPGFIMMGLTENNAAMYMGVGAALVMILLFCVLIFAVPAFAAKVLKPGYTVNDVKKFLIFLIIIAVFMLIGFGISASAVLIK